MKETIRFWAINVIITCSLIIGGVYSIEGAERVGKFALIALAHISVIAFIIHLGANVTIEKTPNHPSNVVNKKMNDDLAADQRPSLEKNFNNYFFIPLNSFVCVWFGWWITLICIFITKLAFVMVVKEAKLEIKNRPIGEKITSMEKNSLVSQGD